MQPTISIADPWQQELQQRMALAKQQGWADADIQRSASVETAMHQQQVAQQQQQQQAQQPAPTSGRGGFLTSLISELGGAGGAAGGAALGTAIAPGIGTIIGAGLGGLLGGTGGSALEQEVRNGKVNTGQALKEGGMDALFSAGGEGLAAGKLALQASKAAKTSLPAVAGDLFRASAPEATQAGAHVPGFLQNTGNDLITNSLGLGQGGRGASQIGAAESENLLGTLKTLGVPLGSPEKTQAALEGKMNTLGTALQTAYQRASTAVPISQSDVQNLATGILQKVSTMGGLTDADKNYALQQAQTLVNNGGDLNQLWNFTKDIESRINFGRSGASAEPGTEMVNNTIKGDVRDFLNAKVPAASDLNNAYSSATTANNLLISAAGKGGIGVGFPGNLIPASPVRTIETKAGQALNSLGQLTAGTGTGTISGPVSDITRQLTRQTPADLFSSTSNNTQSMQQQAAQPQPAAPGAAAASPFANPTNPDQQVLNAASQSGATSFNDFANALSMSDQAGLTGTNAGTASSGSSGATSDQYVQAAMRAAQAGDYKSYTSLMGIANGLQSYEAANTKDNTPTLNATQQKNVTATQTAIERLKSFGTQLDALGSGVSGNIASGNLASLLGHYVPFSSTADKNAYAIQSQARDIAIQVATSISNGTKPSAQTIDQVERSLPLVTDSPQARQDKLNYLISGLQTNLNIASTPVSQLTGQTNSSAPTDQLANLMSQLGYGQ